MAYTPSPNAYTSSMPKMGTVEMGLEVSRQVLPKIFAKEAYHKGYMVNDRYNAELQNSLQVLVPKFNRPTGKFRSLTGVQANPYTATKEHITQTYDVLSIDMEYNDIIEVAEDQIVQNLQGNGVITTMVDMLSSKIAEEINIITAAGIYGANLEYNGGKAKEDMKIEFVDKNSSTVSIPDCIASAVAKIGNADADKGDTSFNDYKVSQVISNTLWSYLMKTKNQFILESSYGQELLIDGTFGEITLDGVYAFKGKILDVYTFVLPDNFFPRAGGTVFAHNPVAGKVYGIMGVAEATERAFIDRGVKITDAVNFRGWELQPLYRVGVNCVKPWGTALLVSDDFSDANLLAPEVALDFAQGSQSGKTKATFSGDGVTALAKKADVEVYLGETSTLLTADGFSSYTSASDLTASAEDKYTIALIKNNKVVEVCHHTVDASEIK